MYANCYRTLQIMIHELNSYSFSLSYVLQEENEILYDTGFYFISFAVSECFLD